MSEDAIDRLCRTLAIDRRPAGIWRENAATVRAFLSVATQWRVVAISAMAGGRVFFVGLDYTAAKVGLEAAGIVITSDLWAGLCMMEEAARDALNESNR
jgi:hypothetical protein